MSLILKVTAKSQFMSEPVFGFRACTPTALYFAYRFLKLADANEMRMEADFYQQELCDGVENGGKLNKALPHPYQRKSAQGVLGFIQNTEHPIIPPDTLVEDKSLPAILDPLRSPADNFLLPNVIQELMQGEEAGNIAVIATCAGHTTVIMRLLGNYFFIDSATNFFQSTLEIHDAMDSLLDSIQQSWGSKAIQADLTRVSLQRELNFTEWFAKNYPEHDEADEAFRATKNVEFLADKSIRQFLGLEGTRDYETRCEELLALKEDPNSAVESLNLKIIKALLEDENSSEVTISVIEQMFPNANARLTPQ